MRLIIEFVGGSWDGEVLDLDVSSTLDPAQPLALLGELHPGALFIMPSFASLARSQNGGFQKVLSEQWRLTDRKQGPNGILLRCDYLKPHL
jgi:hypothetical protein